MGKYSQKVNFLVIFYGKLSSKLTFENFIHVIALLVLADGQNFSKIQFHMYIMQWID